MKDIYCYCEMETVIYGITKDTEATWNQAQAIKKSMNLQLSFQSDKKECLKHKLL